MNQGESRFEGGLLGLIGWSILGLLVSVLTLGICCPWAIVMIYRWITENTVINGRRLKFDGTGMQLFGNWIKWLLLTIITLGIFGLWVPIKIKAWTTKHTSFVEEKKAKTITSPTLDNDSTSKPSSAFQNGNTWVCKKCGETNSNGAILCRSCGR